MHWLHPPIIKIYEALGAVVDGRVKIDGNSGSVISSSGNKSYIVSYDPGSQSIMTNDNSSFYHDYLGYPAIAFLMLSGEVRYKKEVAELLKDIPWKDINQKFKNDYTETIEYILSSKTEKEIKDIQTGVLQIEEQFRSKHYKMLGKKVKPPEGY